MSAESSLYKGLEEKILNIQISALMKLLIKKGWKVTIAVAKIVYFTPNSCFLNQTMSFGVMAKAYS